MRLSTLVRHFYSLLQQQRVLFKQLNRRRALSVRLSFRYGPVLDFSRPKVKEDAPLNLNKATTYEEPSRTASAKQHYLKQSRYLPGNILSVDMYQNIFLVSAPQPHYNEINIGVFCLYLFCVKQKKSCLL